MVCGMTSSEPLIEASVTTVKKAAERFGKSRLADAAEVPESTIRSLLDDSWNPRRDTLRRLEVAAVKLEREHTEKEGCDHRESAR